VTTFVVVAAGRGSRLGRVGDDLHKCLIPLAGRAILSRQFDLAPSDARLVVVTGYRADQVRNYVRLAHPDRDVTFVHDDGWGRGPGASLLRAREVVGYDDVIWTACDTLWDHDDGLWNTDSSWLAVAPIPAGTPAARWCRVVPSADGDFVQRVDDKTPDVAPGSLASTAFGYVIADDLDVFWPGLDLADGRAGELQFSSGLDGILDAGRPLELRHIRWLDVGDEAAYRAAQATLGAYDDVKPGLATYVLPDTGRVVKFSADMTRITRRIARAKQLDQLVPPLVEPHASDMMAYHYVDGRTGYTKLRDGQSSTVLDLLEWWRVNFWSSSRETLTPPNWYDTVMKFYRDKTFQRVMALPRELQTIALDAVTRVDWHELVEGAVPGTFHGDLTLANVVHDDGGHWHAIDWREDFGNEQFVGDLRYDLGKLLGGTEFHWENAADGDFHRWEHGQRVASQVLRFASRELDLPAAPLHVIGALTLINSSPLHAAPMDEILVTRGARWLERMT
jgi:dTDP-glucose pyrophosphorylase